MMDVLPMQRRANSLSRGSARLMGELDALEREETQPPGSVDTEPLAALLAASGTVHRRG